MNRKKLYWIFQIAGWLLFIGYECLNYTVLGYFSGKFLLYMTLNAFCFFLVSHGVHLLMKRIKIFGRRASVQLIAFIAGVVLQALLWLGVSLINSGISGFAVSVASFTMFASALINFCIITGGWMTFYWAFNIGRRFNEMQVEKLQMQLAMQHTELAILHSQLNPHFLFNALNSIRSLIISNPAKAREAATLLSSLLRYTLNYGQKKLITLQEEMEMVKYYLQLEKMRFEERLQYSIQHNTHTEKIMIPPVLLLTVTENAVKHGISQHEEGGIITFNICEQNDLLNVTVTNTGQILNPDEPGNGIGMDNSEKRLEMLYSGKAKLELLNGSNNTVITKLEIPVLRNEN